MAPEQPLWGLTSFIFGLTRFTETWQATKMK
jgi:hypothetical protein